MLIDYSEPYEEEIHNLIVKYGLNWTHSPGGIEIYKKGVDDTCNIAGYFTKKEYDKLVNWIKRNNISEEIRMMLNSPLGGRRGIGFGLGRSWQRKSADWWLAGGISTANVVGAWQAVGAESYETSKIDLTGNGHGAYEGVAPTWNTTDGWIDDGTQYLLTDIIPEKNWTFICRVDNVSGYNKGFMGVFRNGGTAMYIYAFKNNLCFANRLNYSSDSSLNVNDIFYGSGVVCMAGADCYFNGTLIGTIPNAVFDSNIYLSLMSIGEGTYPLLGNWKAGSVYNTSITPTQVSALTAAMNAL